ncbi:DUF802 domain-containing protein [Ramlibacter rhizophilus]|uniref:DUF802 domain-containing protein n=1 Tax=Ramlibacter rhizophilus TaxID=1781167 RepID=A0A4Z0BZL8_9BURK|nr:DUF802 domain-containing protein [Ramlibacter rhizophilus]TFZ04797.1 DUF802 domain-containing protein [Ramlibacter rhizophilus]
MSRIVFAAAFALGLAVVGWVGAGFVGTSVLALGMTLAIAATYLLGALELRRFRAATAALDTALAGLSQPPTELAPWVERLPQPLRQPVQARIEGERVPLPGPALTPYLVGLLVMLGMLGTFLGMVLTFQGAVFALERSTDLLAIRSALAAPIKGLGLSFGTSVAGVAASAMLGLMSALCRRERLEAVRRLDACIATVLRPFSRLRQREESARALQVQAHALPQLVDRVQALIEGVDRRHHALGEALAERQQSFHQEVKGAYTALAADVAASLRESLVAGARESGESLRPVLESALAGMAQESRRLHAQQVEAATRQVEALSAQFGATARGVTEGWQAALERQARAGDALAARLDASLDGFAQRHAAQGEALLQTLEESAAARQATLAASDRERLDGWREALAGMAEVLRTDWQRLGDETLAQQRAVCDTLERSAAQVSGQTTEHASRTLAELSRLLDQADALARARADSESRWSAEQAERMDQLAALWRSELSALRQEEAARGEAAVARLGELQAAVAGQLAQLGTALEAPMARLMQTAAEVPQAASELIARLRGEMQRITERDNLALDERKALLGDIGALLASLTRAAGEQREATEALLQSAAAAMDQAQERFAQALDQQGERARDTAVHVAASAVELASLGEAFQQGVSHFGAANEKLVDSLRRIDAGLQQSLARSDEQLAYYVAQAREVIDLSIASQQGIVEDLRRLRTTPALAVEEGA